MAKSSRTRSWKGFLPKGAVIMASKGMASKASGLPSENCKLCKLCKGRTQLVIGEGSLKAKLMIIGEAPGEAEDLAGRPFVGRAGNLLDKMIEAIGLSRAEVYICNVVKCRPPENRNPEADEIEACSPFLAYQIDTIKPDVIMALGKFSTQTLLNSETPISELRGKVFEYRGAKLIPTFHPAYLLRAPSAKKEAWDDLKLIAKEMGIKIPNRPNELSKMAQAVEARASESRNT